VRLLIGLAVIACVGAGALLAIGPNRTSDWKASDCGAPIRWLTDDHPDSGVIVPFSGAATFLPQGDCGPLVWRQIRGAAGLGATGLGLVAVAIVVTRTRPPRGAMVRLSAV